MASGVNPTSGSQGSDDSSLANQAYVDGLNDPNNAYDPEGLKHAIEKATAAEKATIEAGGHVSMGDTMLLMYLMQGFGGEVVGSDGQAASALTKVQGDISNMWSVMNAAGAGGTPPIDPTTKKPYATFTEAFNAYYNLAQADINGSNIPASEKKQLTDSLAQVKVALETGTGTDPLKELYDKAKPKPPVPPATTPTQGDPSGVDGLTRGMTTVNQQVTGASQMMATQAKTDSKTQTSEQDVMNNYMQMIKKMLSYFTPAQRPS